MNWKSTAVCVAFAAASLCTGWAQSVLVSWDVNGLNAASTPDLTGSMVAHLDSANLTLGSGITASSAASTFGGSNFDQSTFASALANNDYLAFTLTPTAGYSLSLSSVSYLIGKSSSDTTLSAMLTSSVNGHTADAILDTYTFSNASPTLRSVTLSNLGAFQNLTGSVEFRLYGVSSSTDTFRVRSNSGADLTLNGTLTAVPEPATTAVIVGLLAITWVVWQRRRTATLPAETKKPAEIAGLIE